MTDHYDRPCGCEESVQLTGALSTLLNAVKPLYPDFNEYQRHAHAEAMDVLLAYRAMRTAQEVTK